MAHIWSPQLFVAHQAAQRLETRGAGQTAACIRKLWLHCAGLNVSGAAITTVNGQPSTQMGSLGSPTPAVSLLHTLRTPSQGCSLYSSIDQMLLQAEIQKR